MFKVHRHLPAQRHNDTLRIHEFANPNPQIDYLSMLPLASPTADALGSPESPFRRVSVVSENWVEWHGLSTLLPNNNTTENPLSLVLVDLIRSPLTHLSMGLCVANAPMVRNALGQLMVRGTLQHLELGAGADDTGEYCPHSIHELMTKAGRQPSLVSLTLTARIRNEMWVGGIYFNVVGGLVSAARLETLSVDIQSVGVEGQPGVVGIDGDAMWYDLCPWQVLAIPTLRSLTLNAHISVCDDTFAQILDNILKARTQNRNSALISSLSLSLCADRSEEELAATWEGRLARTVRTLSSSPVITSALTPLSLTTNIHKGSEAGSAVLELLNSTEERGLCLAYYANSRYQSRSEPDCV